MKNPFIKEDNSTAWIAAALAGAFAVGAGVWFYLHGKRAAAREAYRLEHAQDYLDAKRQKKKKHKTDVNELADLVHPHQ